MCLPNSVSVSVPVLLADSGRFHKHDNISAVCELVEQSILSDEIPGLFNHSIKGAVRNYQGAANFEIMED